MLNNDNDEDINELKKNVKQRIEYNKINKLILQNECNDECNEEITNFVEIWLFY